MDGAAQCLFEAAKRGRALLILAENDPNFTVMTFAGWAAGMLPRNAMNKVVRSEVRTQ